MFSKIRNWIAPDIGIDLGSENTRVFVRGRGVVLDVPSVMAVQTDDLRVIAVSEDAKGLVRSRPCDIMFVAPLKNGQIDDVDVTVAFLRHCIECAYPRHWWHKIVKPRLMIAASTETAKANQGAMELAAHKAGAGAVFLLELSMAAAIGAGLPVSEPTGCMIVEIGAASCTAAIISLAGIVTYRACPGSMTLDLCIVQHMLAAHNLSIDGATAESVKLGIGSACPMDRERGMDVSGNDAATGLPRTVTVTSREIRKAIASQVSFMVTTVQDAIKASEPELCSGLLENGIVLSGGGSLLRGLDELLAKATGLKVARAENPFLATVEGVGVALNELDFLAKNRKS